MSIGSHLKEAPNWEIPQNHFKTQDLQVFFLDLGGLALQYEIECSSPMAWPFYPSVYKCILSGFNNLKYLPVLSAFLALVGCRLGKEVRSKRRPYTGFPPLWHCYMCLFVFPLQLLPWKDTAIINERIPLPLKHLLAASLAGALLSMSYIIWDTHGFKPLWSLFYLCWNTGYPKRQLQTFKFQLSFPLLSVPTEPLTSG